MNIKMFRKNLKSKAIEKPIKRTLEPTKEDALNILAGVEYPLIEHANFFNKYYGLPTFSAKSHENLHPARVSLAMVHYERYAREMGWIGND